MGDLDESFWSVSDSITKMEEIKDLEQAKDYITELTDSLEQHKSELQTIQQQHRDALEKAEKETVKLRADLESFKEDDPPTPNSAEALVAAGM